MRGKITNSAIMSLALSLFLVTSAGSDESDLVWSTFLGGSDSDVGDGNIARDGAGNIYVIATTGSADFPTSPGAFDTTISSIDVFVAKLDPTGSVLVYATFLGGRNSDVGYGLDVDDDGNAYLTGCTDSYDFPTTPGAFDTSLNDSPEYPWPYFDAFVTKLNPGGSGLVYSTFLGGTEVNDGGYNILVDDFGNAYIAGGAGGADFPITSGAFDTTYNGGAWAGDVFVAKFNDTGSTLEYSTYLGGIYRDWQFGLAIDDLGCAYVIGATESPDFPIIFGCVDVTYNGSWDAYVAKLSSTGSELEYGTFLGGSDEDQGWGIAVDSFGSVHVTGSTSSSDFPVTAGAFDVTHNGGIDIFVAKLDGTMSSLIQATFLGGSEGESSFDIGVDDSGKVYIIGQTLSADFPTTTGSFDETYNGGTDVIVAKLNTTSSSLEYATYLGGSDIDEACYALALDGYGNVYIDGATSSSDFPVTPGAYDETHNGFSDNWVAKLHLSGGTTVPVMLISFQAVGNHDYIALEWITSSETNCHKWVIARSDVLEGEYENIGEISGHGSTETEYTYQWVDRHISPGVTYYYKLNQVDFDGSETWSSIVSAAASTAVPETYALHQNYPNPFNPTTDITYAIPRDEHVTVKVYNVQGAEVTTLVDAHQRANLYTVSWDADGLASGVYFCRLQAGKFGKTIKMILLK